MKRFIYVLIALLVISSCKPNKYNGLQDGLYAEIETNKGNILVALYADDVPLTVANFVSLAEGTNFKLPDSLKGKNFYKGLIFHRVVNNFVIQGGGFTPNGKKNTGYVFGDEFPKNNKGDLLYRHNDQGILSMANGGPATNNSQFFITHRLIPHLDGKHSVFGKTIANPNELKKIKVTDSLLLKKSIDSLRMDVVKKIVQNDTIISVNIIKVGSKAKAFDASEVFKSEFEKFSISEKERKEQEIEADKARYSKYLEEKQSFLAKMDESKATKTSSGLRILMLEKNPKGKKVDENKPTTIHYTLYVANGKKIQSTKNNNGNPFTFKLNDAQRPMISGFKEGLSKLRQGEKARLFIPYYIAYGEDAFGPFPKKADLVFDIEILKVD